LKTEPNRTEIEKSKPTQPYWGFCQFSVMVRQSRPGLGKHFPQRAWWTLWIHAQWAAAEKAIKFITKVM